MSLLGTKKKCLFWGLLQHFALAVVFEYAHLLNGYLVEPYQTVGLRPALEITPIAPVRSIHSLAVRMKRFVPDAF